MPLVENQSILMSIKKLLNVEHDDPAFDTDIGMTINSIFMTLHQIGIGPDEGFSITEADTKWSDFSSDKTLIEAVKMYVYLKVRMIFDPPASSVVADAYNSQIHELEWRLNIQAEQLKNEEQEVTEIVPEVTTQPEIQNTEIVEETGSEEVTEEDIANGYRINGENMRLFRNIF